MNVKDNLPSVLLAVGVGLLILVARGSARGDEYVPSISTYAEYTEPYYVWTSTEQAWGSASAGAQDITVGDWKSARVYCSADAQISLSYDESDEREQHGWAIATIEWSWDGPPGTAPGGWLFWNQDDDGRAAADGSYYDHGGTLTVSSDAWSNASAYSPNDSSSATSHAEGSATAPFAGTGSRSASFEPPDDGLIVDDRTDNYPNAYWYSVDWQIYYQPNDLEAIPSGTPAVVLNGYAGCGCSCQNGVGGQHLQSSDDTNATSDSSLHLQSADWEESIMGRILSTRVSSESIPIGRSCSFICEVIVLAIWAAMNCSCRPTPPSARWKATKEPDSSSERKLQAEAGARRAALASVTGSFKPSLEMKENADFLLTPALIVQQAIKNDGPIVYPSE